MLDGWTKTLFFAVVFSALSSWQHGYNMGVTNMPSEVIRDWIRQTPCQEKGENCQPKMRIMAMASENLIWSIIVSIFPVGGAIGSLISGPVAKKFGRRSVLQVNIILVAVAAIFMGSAKPADSVVMLCVGRHIVGLCAGINTPVATMYLTEISPLRLRGTIGTAYALGISVSMSASQLLGFRHLLGTPAGWPWLLALTAVPAALQTAALPFCPESPRHLLLAKRRHEPFLIAFSNILF